MSTDLTDAEPYTVHSARVIRARKEHKCYACKEVIRRGDLYAYTFIVFEGEPDVTKRCARCEMLYQHLWSVTRDTDEGVDDCLNCGHTYQEVHGVEPPEEIAALAFLTPAEAQARMLKNIAEKNAPVL
jgi:hypothetical protein